MPTFLKKPYLLYKSNYIIYDIFLPLSKILKNKKKWAESTSNLTAATFSGFFKSGHKVGKKWAENEFFCSDISYMI